MAAWYAAGCTILLILSGCASETRVADPAWLRPALQATDPETGVAYRKTQVFIRSGADDIASVLLVPEGPRPLRAVIWVAGSQDGLPSPETTLARKLVANQTAVLLLGKKGVGASGGNWRNETLVDRAANVQAAIDWLARRPEVDPARIGLYGHSQGGYVSAILAARGHGLAYAILAATPSQIVRDQIATDYQYRRMRDEGLSPAAARSARARYMFMLDSAMRVCPLVRLHYLCGVYHHDPRPDLERIRIPVLALFGERDPLVPPAENLTAMEAALRSSGAPYAIKVFPQANHEFWKSVRGTASEYAELGRPGPVVFPYARPDDPLHARIGSLLSSRVEFAEGYFDTVLGFVRSNGASPPGD